MSVFTTPRDVAVALLGERHCCALKVIVTVPRTEPVVLVKPTPNAGVVVPLARLPNERLVEAVAPYEKMEPEFPMPVSTVNFTAVEPLPKMRAACHVAPVVEMATNAP